MSLTSEPAQLQKLEQFVVFRLDGETYAAPVLSVTEVLPTLDITPVPNAPSYVLGLVNLRGKIVPVIDLEKKFALNGAPQITRRHIMFAESAQKTLFGVLVDEVEAVQKVPVDAIKSSPELVASKISAEYLGGVILLDNQRNQEEGGTRMVLILDLQKILSAENVAELQTVAQADGATPQQTTNGGES